MGNVRISGLSANTVGHDVFEGVVHQTTVAAHVAVGCRAGNELLLGE